MGIFRTRISTSPITTPNPLCGQFRAAFSAGDLLTPLTGGGQAANSQFGTISNQVSGVGVLWTYIKPGNILPGQATYVGNPRYVYDSSNFTRYKKIKAQGKVYNDKSFGGDIISNQAVALGRVRH